jgi:cytochrome c
LGTVGGDWTFEDLDAFIANPKGFAPGTKMTFAGIPDAEDRATLIAWLNAQSDHPLPLPEVEMMPVEETGSHDEAADSMTDEIVEAVESASDDVASAADAVADEVSDAADDMTEVLESNTDVADNADAGLADDANTPSGVEAMVAAASVDDGQGVAKKCQSCHTFDEGGANRVGPNLWNVVNRPIGSVADYSYSDAMAEAGGTWTYDRLWTYIQDPKTDMPGNKMGFRGISDEADLAALIAYLRSLSNDPAPLAGAP